MPSLSQRRFEKRKAEPFAGGAPAASDTERVARRLRGGACLLDELAGASGLPVERALAALLELEWAGVVVASAGQRWALRAGAGA